MVKVKIELLLNKNGYTCLNFWDALKGNDVVCEVIDGKLMLQVHTQVGGEDVVEPKEITLQEFIDLVHEQRKDFHEE